MGRNTAPINLSRSQLEALRKKQRKFSEAGQHRWADRCRAVILCSEGYGIGDISKILDRPYRTVQDWCRLFRERGIRGMEPRTSSRGSKKKLGEHERKLLAKAIERGPLRCGFKGSVWTSVMVAEYIKKRWGVEYHPGHVRRLLHKLGFSVQFPREKLALADQEAQETWLKETLPEIKKTPERRARK